MKQWGKEKDTTAVKCEQQWDVQSAWVWNVTRKHIYSWRTHACAHAHPHPPPHIHRQHIQQGHRKRKCKNEYH